MRSFFTIKEFFAAGVCGVSRGSDSRRLNNLLPPCLARLPVFLLAALLLLPALLILEHEVQSGRIVRDVGRALLLSTYLLTPAVALLEVARPLGLQPLVLLPVGIALWAARGLRPAT